MEQIILNINFQAQDTIFLKAFLVQIFCTFIHRPSQHVLAKSWGEARLGSSFLLAIDSRSFLKVDEPKD